MQDGTGRLYRVSVRTLRVFTEVQGVDLRVLGETDGFVRRWVVSGRMARVARDICGLCASAQGAAACGKPRRDREARQRKAQPLAAKPRLLGGVCMSADSTKSESWAGAGFVRGGTVRRRVEIPSFCEDFYGFERKARGNTWGFGVRLRVCEKIGWFRGGSCVCGGDICGQRRDRGGLLGRRASLRRDVETCGGMVETVILWVLESAP